MEVRAREERVSLNLSKTNRKGFLVEDVFILMEFIYLSWILNSFKRGFGVLGTKDELKLLLYGLAAAADGACSMAEQEEYENLENELIERFLQSKYEK